MILLITGCTKPENILTDGIWTFEDLTHDSEDEFTSSMLTLGKAVLTDATLEFQESGDYIIDSPLTDNPSIETWELIEDEQLIMNAGDDTSTNTIIVLNKTMLQYSETGVDMSRNIYTVITTWVRE